MQHSFYIAASDVRAYASLDDFGDIIRKLYLPLDVPKWQQLVRVAVLVVGIVEASVCRPPHCLRSQLIQIPNSRPAQAVTSTTSCTPPITSLQWIGFQDGWIYSHNPVLQTYLPAPFILEQCYILPTPHLVIGIHFGIEHDRSSSIR